jgi:hypothetical protein
MFRIPPPEIAMRLAEEHRHDLLRSAGKQSSPRPRDLSPLSGLRSTWARLHELARCHYADRTGFWAAFKGTWSRLRRVLAVGLHIRTHHKKGEQNYVPT